MKNTHSNKTISFLMELIIVLLFFTIASAVSVFVIVKGSEKNDYATMMENAVLYGENILNAKQEKDIRAYLDKDRFYLDEHGNIQQKPDLYKVEILRKNIGDGIQECEMQITHDHTYLTKLSFVLDKGEEE